MIGFHVNTFTSHILKRTIDLIAITNTCFIDFDCYGSIFRNAINFITMKYPFLNYPNRTTISHDLSQIIRYQESDDSGPFLLI